MSAVSCKKCGATMQPDATGRVFTCHYCGEVMQVGIGAEQIAQGMALDLANVDKFLAQLANTLSQGFSECTRIESQTWNGVVMPTLIEVHLEPDVFHVSRNGNHALCHYKKIVRGVALRTTELPIDQWLDKLLDALAAKANESARAAWVLGQLSGPGPKY
jgi:hypothetical protein